MGGFIELLMYLFIFFVMGTALYFIVKNAVKNALREYEDEKK